MEVSDAGQSRGSYRRGQRRRQPPGQSDDRVRALRLGSAPDCGDLRRPARPPGHQRFRAHRRISRRVVRCRSYAARRPARPSSPDRRRGRLAALSRRRGPASQHLFLDRQAEGHRTHPDRAGDEDARADGRAWFSEGAAMTRAACGTIVLVAACAGALIAAVVLPAPSPPREPDANDTSSLAFQPHPGARLPLAATLIDEDGRPVLLGDYFAKSPVIVVLDYLRCTSLCGVSLRHLVVDALDRLPLEPGRDYQVVAVSIDPRDRPADAAAARAKYAGLLGRDTGERGMHLLTTSSPAAVREIADAVGFPYRYDALSDAYIHPAGFVVVAAD